MYLVAMRITCIVDIYNMINVTTRLCTDWRDVIGPTYIPGFAYVNGEPTRFVWLKSCCCSPVTVMVV